MPKWRATSGCSSEKPTPESLPPASFYIVSRSSGYNNIKVPVAQFCPDTERVALRLQILGFLLPHMGFQHLKSDCSFPSREGLQEHCQVRVRNILYMYKMLTHLIECLRGQSTDYNRKVHFGASASWFLHPLLITCQHSTTIASDGLGSLSHSSKLSG